MNDPVSEPVNERERVAFAAWVVTFYPVGSTCKWDLCRDPCPYVICGDERWSIHDRWGAWRAALSRSREVGKGGV